MFLLCIDKRNTFLEMTTSKKRPIENHGMDKEGNIWFLITKFQRK